MSKARLLVGSGLPVGSVEALLEAIPDVMARLDPTGQVLEVRFSRALADPGPRATWEGRSLAEVLPPAKAATWMGLIERCLETGRLQCERLEVNDEENNHHGVYEIRIARVSSEEVVAIARNVTEEEAARQREAASRKFLAGVTAATPFVLFIYNLALSRLTYSNRNFYAELGYGEDHRTPSGRDPILELVHPEDAREFSDVMARLRAIPDGHSVEQELRFRTGDGSWGWFRVRVSVFSRNAEGEPTEVFGAFEEVTQRRELERQVSQSEKLEAVGEVAASLAHNFNNQLTAVGVYTELLARHVSEDPIAADYASLALSAVDRASELTRKLVSFSRAAPRATGKVDLCEFVGDLVPLLKEMVGPRIEVRFECPADPAPIEIDPSEFEQVIVNLAINARDAMPDGGRLSLAVEVRGGAQGSMVALVVSDTGVGMSDEVRARAFDPFFTTKAKGKGTGLGLASLDRIVTAAGGAVELSSSEGKGSTFTLLFPLVAVARSVPATTAAPEAQREQTVLLVDDEPAIRRLEKEYLESSGFRVLAASSATEARALAEAQPFDLLLTDVLMPGMTGPELAASLVRARPGLPVLYVSGYVGSSQIGGLGELLPKPFTSESLVTAVRGALDRSRLAG